MSSAVAIVGLIIRSGLVSPLQYESVGPPPIHRSPAITSKPVVTVQMFATTDEQSLEGDSGLQQAYVQINSSHPSQDTADILRESIKDILLSYTGTVLGRVVQGFTHVVDNDLYLEQTKLWQCATRFKAAIEKI